MAVWVVPERAGRMVERDVDLVFEFCLRRDVEQDIVAVAAGRDMQPMEVHVDRVEAFDAGGIILDVRRRWTGRIVRVEPIVAGNPHRVAGFRLDHGSGQASAVGAQLDVVHAVRRAGISDLVGRHLGVDVQGHEVADHLRDLGVRDASRWRAGKSLRRCYAFLDQSRRRDVGLGRQALRDGRARPQQRQRNGQKERNSSAHHGCAPLLINLEMQCAGRYFNARACQLVVV